MITAGEVGRRLDLSARDVRKLATTGLLMPEIAGRSTVFEVEAVDALAARPYVAQRRPPAVAVRLGKPEPVHDPSWPQRRWKGWHAGWNADTKRDAARGWWQVKNPRQWIGRPLVALVTDFVVATYVITDFEKDRGDTRFTVDEQEVPEYAGHRLRLGPGPIALPL